MDINESLEWIRAYAQNQRDAAATVIGWKFDAWKAELGMVEVMTEEYKLWDVDNRPTRKQDEDNLTAERPYRFVPTGNGRGILVRDWA